MHTTASGGRAGDGVDGAGGATRCWRQLQVSISPVKQTRETTMNEEPHVEEDINEYKIWLAEMVHVYPEMGKEYKDDYRQAIIKTYKQWLTTQNKLTDDNTNDDPTIPEDETQDSTPSLTKWLSHARRHKEKVNDVMDNVKESIASYVLNKWDLQNIDNAEQKILDIARERYKGWRGTLSATYQAYKIDADRMKNKPEDADTIEWYYLLKYFATEEFKQINRKNTGCCKEKSPSIVRRDQETGEEPDDIELWLSTHTRNGRWTNSASQDVYVNTTLLDNAISRLSEREIEQEGNQQKRIELEADVQKLKEQVARDVAEREKFAREVEERDQLKWEELREQLREDFRAQLRKEMQSMFAAKQQSNPPSNTENDGTHVPPVGNQRGQGIVSKIQIEWSTGWSSITFCYCFVGKYRLDVDDPRQSQAKELHNKGQDIAIFPSL
ncbi:hypothetical protein U9M48_028510 [Paspalum notatum var. saurae]|uniref:Uncharacterized protein n=1 Tax=Paspalum notatum var. saurae TaxID=547442 RepID=A0AAQ3TWK5_PASNO